MILKIFFLLILTVSFPKLLACSNSITAEDSANTLSNLNISKCLEEEKKFVSDDSTYYQCINGKWESVYDEWTSTPIEDRFLPIKTGKFIPNANFNTPFTLQPPLPLHNGIVRCTFDGSEPDSTSQILLSNRVIDTTTVVRCTEFASKEIKQKQTETYFINEFIHMPVLSISVAPNYVSEYLDAPPCKPDPCKEAKFWDDAEYPVHVEYFAEGSSSKDKGFEINAGISIAGHWSRNQQKKSVSIILRKKYEQGKLHYPLFDTRSEKNTFKAFVLRNNGNRFSSDYIEDAMATSLLEGTNVDYQRSRQVIVFYNGQYYGIYDMREKLNEYFIETNYGIQSQSVDLIKHSDKEISEQNGTATDYLNILRYISNTDFKNNEVALDSIKKTIDIGNYIEYMAAEIYYHNLDWPQNNVRAWKSDSALWKFIAFDIDFGFNWGNQQSQQINMIDWIINGGKKSGICHNNSDFKCFHNMFKKLIQNNSFKQAFINRSAYLYSTFLNAQKIIEHVNDIVATIDPKQISRYRMLYDRHGHLTTCSTGFDYDGSCLKNWSKERDKTVREDLRDKFDLGNNISITIEIRGSGRLKLDNIYVQPQKKYYWTVFQSHPMHLLIECPANSKNVVWENGSNSPSRIITPTQNKAYIGECI